MTAVQLKFYMYAQCTYMLAVESSNDGIYVNKVFNGKYKMPLLNYKIIVT